MGSEENFALEWGGVSRRLGADWHRGGERDVQTSLSALHEPGRGRKFWSRSKFALCAAEPLRCASRVQLFLTIHLLP